MCYIGDKFSIDLSHITAFQSLSITCEQLPCIFMLKNIVINWWLFLCIYLFINLQQF